MNHTEDEYSRSSGKGKFRFKSSSSSSSSTKPPRPNNDNNNNNKNSEESHRHRHRHKHRKRTRTRSRSPSPGSRNQPAPLSPNTAFRESLFDALGDDEGAAFWESVYGQPIHNYAVPGTAGAEGSGEGGGGGELERMTEDEYAAYVRSQMWKRTREGMLEEQERMRAEKRRERRERERAEEEKMRFERAMDESLRRGRERRRVKAWRGVWEEYLRSWGEIERAVEVVKGSGDSDAGAGAGAGERTKLRNLIFWPVESGKRRDISREMVEEFMRCALPATAAGTASDDKNHSADLLATLKTERVRWHPDKIQHRYGALGIDEPVMRSVTEVFQIIDRLWNEVKT